MDLVPLLDTEIPLQTVSDKGGTFKLVFKMFGDGSDQIERVIIKYHDISKRKLM
jgi:hypothetical protein